MCFTIEQNKFTLRCASAERSTGFVSAPPPLQSSPSLPMPPEQPPQVLFSIFTDKFEFPFTSDFSFGSVQVFMSMTTAVTGTTSIFTAIGSFSSFKVGTSNSDFFFGESTVVRFWLQPLGSNDLPSLQHLELVIGSTNLGDLLDFALETVEVGGTVRRTMDSSELLILFRCVLIELAYHL